MTRSFLLILISFFLTVDLFAAAELASDESEVDQRRQVTFYPTYGYMDGDTWVIPLRAYVHRDRRMWERLTTRQVRSRFNLRPEEADNFRYRIRDFVTNSRSGREVQIEFENDPQDQKFGIIGDDGMFVESDNYGYIVGHLRIHKERAQELLDAQEGDDNWLRYSTVSDRYYGEGNFELIEPEGLSVVSDVDDTIKITEIPAGSRIVVRNTFFKDYTAAPGMAEKYNNYEDATFHYVSGSPWQLFNPLHSFLIEEAGFPKGTFHMKTVRKSIFRLGSWSDLRELATDEMVTFNQKINQISQLFTHFPDREFILIGDSGERDPEVYNTIRDRFPDQVREIIIRDVLNHRNIEPDRLEGMNIIRARTITPGTSQFGSP